MHLLMRPATMLARRQCKAVQPVRETWRRIRVVHVWISDHVWRRRDVLECIGVAVAVKRWSATKITHWHRQWWHWTRVHTVEEIRTRRWHHQGLVNLLLYLSLLLVLELLIDGGLELRLRLDSRLFRWLSCWLLHTRVVTRLGRAATVLVRTSVLLHVVLARKCLVAFWTEGIFLAGVLLRVSRSVARGCEKVGATNLLRHRTWVLVLLRLLRSLGVRCTRRVRDSRRLRRRRV